MAGFADFMENRQILNLNLVNKEFYNGLIPNLFNNLKERLKIKTNNLFEHSKILKSKSAKENLRNFFQ